MADLYAEAMLLEDGLLRVCRIWRVKVHQEILEVAAHAIRNVFPKSSRLSVGGDHPLFTFLCLASELNAPRSAHSAFGHDHTGITTLFMMASGKSYPRATLRKILKAHSRKKVGKGVDSLVYLDYVLFIEEYV
jgi:predicted RNA binding protein YcfA (HicA-like mRNA interferase family)